MGEVNENAGTEEVMKNKKKTGRRELFLIISSFTHVPFVLRGSVYICTEQTYIQYTNHIRTWSI